LEFPLAGPARRHITEVFRPLAQPCAGRIHARRRFRKCGEGHVRISAFNSRENVETALTRIAAALK